MRQEYNVVRITADKRGTDATLRANDDNGYNTISMRVPDGQLLNIGDKVFLTIEWPSTEETAA